MTRIYALLVAVGMLMVGGCGLLPPGFGERDEYVINTPKYFDNRVFYVGMDNDPRESRLNNASTVRAQVGTATRIDHGSPLSIILSSVSLPPPELSANGKPKSEALRDIAVILNVGTKSTGESESIVAWYQRGVHSDQSLNFSNLLLYFEPRWDARVAPLVRIRVVDVTSEKNAEVRDALAKVQQFTGSMGAILPTSTESVVSVASRAAALILSRPNEQLLDYTVQFYSDEQLASSYGSDLMPLRRGRVLLVGRPLGQSSEYWDKFAGRYNGNVLQVYNGQELVRSPVVTMTISTAQSVVPALVKNRSAYLQKLLSDAQQQDIAAVQSAGKAVWDGVKTYALLEELRRSRDEDSLTALYTAYDDTAGDSLGSDDKALLRETLRDISVCTLQSNDDISAWWSKNSTNLKFEKDKFKLVGENC